MAFESTYTITPNIMTAMASIEVSRHKMIELPITAPLIVSLRESARLASTHHSTAIEGNQLSAAEVPEVILAAEAPAVVQGHGHFPHREKDEREVLNYYNALQAMEQLAQSKDPISEQDIQLLHGLSFEGRVNPTPYRDGQNVIRNGKLVVYIPPKADDVLGLMKDLVVWIEASVIANLPIPFIAGLAHYQFATIHPYYDGNGRTARLLATLILHKYGYGLRGIYSLEEYYARNLHGYYGALTVGSDEDYYDGNRKDGDITAFLEYFVVGMAEAFDRVCVQAQQASKPGTPDQSLILRDLSPRQRQVLKLFITSRTVGAKDIGHFFGINDRQARHLCQQWVADGFLQITDPAPKTRRYGLVERYERLVREFK